jgi:hypothetical protein
MFRRGQGMIETGRELAAVPQTPIPAYRFQSMSI